MRYECQANEMGTGDTSVPIRFFYHSATTDLAVDAPLAAEGPIGFEVDTEPVTLQADGDRLIQTLVTLMDSALPHTPDGGMT